MIRLLILLTSLATCVAAEPQPSPTLQFRATVQEVVPLASFSGPMTVIDSDPRYVLALRIMRIKVINGTTNLAAGGIAHLAVHSPSKIFAGEPKEGQTYDFELDRKTEGDLVTYSGLRLRKPAAKKRASLGAGRPVLFAFGHQ
jgi:hypothetical protein